jgi:hypothetical protein
MILCNSYTTVTIFELKQSQREKSWVWIAVHSPHASLHCALHYAIWFRRESIVLSSFPFLLYTVQQYVLHHPTPHMRKRYKEVATDPTETTPA